MPLKGNPVPGVPILYLSLTGNPDYVFLCVVIINMVFSDEVGAIKYLYTINILKWEDINKSQKLRWIQEFIPCQSVLIL